MTRELALGVKHGLEGFGWLSQKMGVSSGTVSLCSTVLSPCTSIVALALGGRNQLDMCSAGQLSKLPHTFTLI
jgi:hypothetical protein